MSRYFFNLESIEPLKWIVSDGHPANAAFGSIQLTGRHIHAHPAVIRFMDGSVSCAFFDEGKLIDLEQMYPDFLTINLSAENVKRLIPTAVERIPVPHIKRHKENVDAIKTLVVNQDPLSSFSK